MHVYTFNNHFKFGYDGNNFFQDRPHATANFTAEYGKITKTCDDWRKSNEVAAKMIHEKAKDPVVLLSGGMDSEICLRSFTDQGLPVKAVSLRLIDINQEEIGHIERIKKEIYFKHQYVDLNLNKFIGSSDFYEIADSIQCVSPILVTHLWLCDQISGTPIIAQGEVHLKKDVPSDYVPGKSPYLRSSWYLYESERLCSLYRHFIKRKREAIPGFFQYLPEQFYSFLTKNKILQNLISDKVIGKLGTRTSKNLISHQFYPDVPLRTKLHGWESIQNIHDDFRACLAKRYPYNDDYYRIEVHDLIARLSRK
jgi:hypothetical protein